MYPKSRVDHISGIGEIKQVIVIRADLKMGKGKIAAQACHASVLATFDAQRTSIDWFNKWMDRGMGKIVVKVHSEEDLNSIHRLADLANLPKALINDAGHTQLEPGTATAVGIGPAPIKKIDLITKKLKLL